MTWYSTARGNYPVAHRDEDTGTVLLDFGKYDGRALIEVPDSYLGWMIDGGGKAFLPDDLIDLAADVLARRQDARALIEVPDLRHGADVIAWADRAPAGDVAEVATRCRIIADTLTAVLDDRAGSTLAQLLEEVG
jgi:hypothetical protein